MADDSHQFGRRVPGLVAMVQKKAIADDDRAIFGRFHREKARVAGEATRETWHHRATGVSVRVAEAQTHLNPDARTAP